VLGAVAGPAAFASGARLGAASFTDTATALIAIACAWALMFPALIWLSSRFDGVALPGPGQAWHG